MSRLAKKGGVMYLSASAIKDVRNMALTLLENVTKDALVISESSGRKTLTVKDLEYVLKGRFFGSYETAKPCRVFPKSRKKVGESYKVLPSTIGLRLSSEGWVCETSQRSY
jgi:Histones H3 and H4